MEVSMTAAAISAALSVLLGAAMGAVYDFIRFFRIVFGVDVSSPFKKGKKRISGYIFVCAGDFLFFAVLSISMCIFFFLTGDGRMRAYALCGAFLGFLIYYNTLGKLFIAVSTRLVFLFKRAVKYIISLFAAPFVYVFCAVKKTTVHFLTLPIVKRGAVRYNDYIAKRKKKAKNRRKNRMMKSGCRVTNGGAQGEKIK